VDDADMALPLARPDHIRVRLIDPLPATAASAASRSVARVVVGAVVRGLAVGLGLGLLIVAGSGAASLTVAGIVALGAAMAGWDP
jgi:predicted lipid-binding transport protein (Tim44 family)